VTAGGWAGGGCGATASRRWPAPWVPTQRERGKPPPHDGEPPRYPSRLRRGVLDRPAQSPLRASALTARAWSCSPQSSSARSGDPSARRRCARWWSTSAPAQMNIGPTALKAARDRHHHQGSPPLQSHAAQKRLGRGKDQTRLKRKASAEARHSVRHHAQADARHRLSWLVRVARLWHDLGRQLGRDREMAVRNTR
jgi:hypothetical protein